jgi:hypothetical protein
MEKDKLEQEIAEARRSISSDGYPMSVGELTNLYKDGELNIRPEFQRFFRWSPSQKSKLVESLLLGIPLPSIFVAQSPKGTWELVDGLQRVSTILQLQGELKNEQEEKLEPLRLLGTKYLPSLEGRVWQNADPAQSLSDAQRLDIKRSKIDIKIIKRESSVSTKFDLFQRLNSYGSPLNSQEMRSALLVAISIPFYNWLEELSRYEPFTESVVLSERLIEERYDVELVTRYLVLHNWPGNKMNQSALRDLPQILDDKSVEFALSNPNGSTIFSNIFRKSFDLIVSNGADDIMRRYDPASGEVKGSFLNSSFEIIALGLGYHMANDTPYRTDLKNVQRELWAMNDMQKGFATGRSTEARLVQFLPLGRKLLAK